MAIPAILAAMAKGYLADKALDAVGVPQGVPRDVLSSGITGGLRGAGKAAVGAALNKGMERFVKGGDDSEDAVENTYNADTDTIAYRKGGKVKVAKRKIDGCAQRGKTRGTMR